MLKKIAVAFLILVFAGCSMRPGYYGKKPLVEKEVVEPAAPAVEPQSVADPTISPGLKKLPLGEKLTFSIRWLGIEAGQTVVTIKEMVNVNGRDCYHIEAFSRTTSFLDLLFRIRDYNDSYVDAEEFYSHRFTKRASEGDHTYDETNDFDYVKNKAFYVNKKKNLTKETNLPGRVQDIVSVSYWFRTQDVKVGDGVKTFLHSDEKNYDVTIYVLKKDQMQMNKKEKIPVMIIEPKAKRGTKPFKKGSAKIWVTDDAERLPLFAELHVIIAGSLNIVLLSKENIYANK